MGNGCIETEAAGEPVVLMPERAVYWPARSTLLVADLHLGKSETLAAHGVPIPRGIVDADLARLTRAITNSGATRVLVLGDLLHATIGTAPALIEQVGAWRQSIGAELWLVPGNHDRRIDRVVEAWGLQVCDPVLCEPPFVFVHDQEHAPCDGAEFAWSGHIHPRVKLKGGGDSLNFPCFLLSERAGLLPAFSCFTAGTTVRLEPSDRAWGVAGDDLVDLSFLTRPASIR